MTRKSLLMVASFVISLLIGAVVARGPSQHDRAPSGSDPRAPVIGLSMDTLKEARWQADRDYFVARAKELGAGNVLVQSANGDDATQVRDVQTLLTSGIDVLVVVAHDGKAMAKAVELAHQSNVPVIAYDRLILSPDLDLYLSFDNVHVGEEQARFLVQTLNGRGDIVRIYGGPTDNNARLLKQGQDNVLRPYLESGSIRVVHEDWAADWKPEEAKKITNAAITKVGTSGIQGVLASNDGTAGGAIQALSEEGIAGKVIVTGQDAELAACQRIVNGTQAMTVYKPVRRLASRAAEMAMRMARGQSVVATKVVANAGGVDTPSVLEDVVVVTPANIRDTIIKDGFLTEQQIFGAATTAPAAPSAPRVTAN